MAYPASGKKLRVADGLDVVSTDAAGAEKFLTVAQVDALVAHLGAA